jgi:hypothetical protein
LNKELPFLFEPKIRKSPVEVFMVNALTAETRADVIVF